VISRRGFLGRLGGCAAHLLWMSAGYGAARRLLAAPPLGRVVLVEPWARIEELGPGVWAVISTPLAGPRGSESWRTVCNGGIVAGRSEVLVLEAFATAEGASWLVQAARELTGRPPTVAVVTHFHADHTGGLPAYARTAEPMVVRATPTTRELLQGKEPLPEATVGQEGITRLDLGGREVRLAPRSGHTPSDVTLEVSEPHVVFCGDLVWNGMFPNYRDATPSKHAASVRDLLGAGEAIYVPGHGPLADRAAVERCIALLDDVEAKARAALAAGLPIEQAADAYRLPAELGDWVMFSPTYFRVAFQAWARELGAK
jgi:glyoxylase-like metal-dependent hydrolase (beta-lactamase superfamily II)